MEGALWGQKDLPSPRDNDLLQGPGYSWHGAGMEEARYWPLITWLFIHLSPWLQRQLQQQPLAPELLLWQLVHQFNVSLEDKAQGGECKCSAHPLLWIQMSVSELAR